MNMNTSALTASLHQQEIKTETTRNVDITCTQVCTILQALWLQHQNKVYLVYRHLSTSKSKIVKCQQRNRGVYIVYKHKSTCKSNIVKCKQRNPGQYFTSFLHCVYIVPFHGSLPPLSPCPPLSLTSPPPPSFSLSALFLSSWLWRRITSTAN